MIPIVAAEYKIADIQALRDHDATATRLLVDYISMFDDDSLTNEQMKNWLDNDWIPQVRHFLAPL